MANDGQIVFEVTADGKHAIADIKDITKAIQTETGKWDNAAKESANNISDSFSGMLKKLVAGFSAVKIGKALLDLGKDALEAASALEEVQNVVDVTFGSDAGKIDQWAKNAGTQFGLTETQAKKFTSTLGAMMKSAGMSGNEITEMSTDLAGLAADMASFYNLDFEEAFAKIRSGISGETEPLKQLGINMSVANLEAYALSKGITKAFNDMSQGEQTMLRYQYMMQATADAQGDFARTSDGYANTVRQLETNIESIKTALGTTFISIAAEATSALSNFLKILIPEAKSKTVLDDFADIDLKTQTKLEDIQKVATEAKLLVDELDSINKTKVDQAGLKVDKFAKDLSNINLDQGKAGQVRDFITTLADNIDVVAALRGESAEGAQTWLNSISSAANSLDENDVEGWENLLGELRTGLPGFENTTFGASFFESLSKDFKSVDTSGILSFIDTLSKDVETVASLRGTDAKEAKDWLDGISESAKKLRPDDVTGWTSLLGELRTGLPGIDNTQYGAAFTSLADGLAAMQPQMSTLSWLESHAGNAGDGIKKFAQNLDEIKLDQGNTKAVGDFIGVLSENVDTVAAIRGESADGAKAWLDKISTAANALDENDVAGWTTLLTEIKEGLPGIENTEFGSAFFSALTGGFNGVSSETDTLNWLIDNLGAKTEKTAEEQAYWLKVCERLVKTIPGLSSIINTETGEIKGGTQAVKDYIKAWEDGQTKLALLGALEQKEAAYASQFSNIPELELDAALAEKKLRDQRKKLDALREKYGIKGTGYDTIFYNNKTGASITERKYLSAGEQEWNKEVAAYNELKTAAESATAKYEEQKKALDEAKIALKEYREAIEEEYGSVESAIAAGVEWDETVKASAKTIIDTALTALDDLGNHYETVLTKMEEAVNKTVDGFNKVDYNSFGKINDKITELTMSMAGLEAGSDEWNKLNNEVEEYNKKLVSTKTIMDALNSQQTFLDDYLKNLQAAQKMGLSDELLAMLSDGSVESAQYLSAIVSGTKEERDAIDKQYQEIQKKKKELAGALTDQQLTVDDVWKDLQEAAKKAVEALDMEGLAQENTGKTVEGMAKGISNHVPEVKAAVDEICTELNRLSDWGISIDLGSFGNIPINAPSDSTKRGNIALAGEPVAFNEKGLDYVPFDGYLSILHAGESILTAEEARIWRQFKDGGNGIDYDMMGGVMRDNVKPGGNVYLDGRVVGSVISDQQGRSYRQLQRSGWQG